MTNISIKNVVKSYWSRFLTIILAIWSFISIILGIILPMAFLFLPAAFISWRFFFNLLPGPFKGETTYIYFLADFGIKIILGIEILSFLIGIIIFLSGFYQIVKARIHKISIIISGIYRYIRHPQNLGIILIAFSFTLYVPGFQDLGIREGDILSWLLFTLFLAIFSNIEEIQLLKKYPEEYSIYQTQTGFFLPKILFRKRLSPKGKVFISNKMRYIFFIVGFFISVFLVHYFLVLLLDLRLIGYTVYK